MNIEKLASFHYVLALPIVDVGLRENVEIEFIPNKAGYNRNAGYHRRRAGTYRGSHATAQRLAIHD
jgi:hypothetical protein